jgi:LCP family protein required for cell wall assembly
MNILVLGSDRREDWTEWHTDAIQIVSIQTDRAAVSILSIPRDLYVYIPEFWMSRINFADYYGETRGYEGGGSALLRDTILYNLGIQIDYTVRTDFDGLIGLVDALGGVDIPVHCRLEDHWPYPDEDGEFPLLTLEPAVHHMDGETALWFARSRQTTSTFSREGRQQQLLRAIYRQMRDTGTLARIPALWDQLQGMVDTDMGIITVLQMGQVGISLRDSNLRTFNIGFDMLEPWTTPYGGNVYLPVWEELEPVLTEMMAPVPDERLTRTFNTVEVWNRTEYEQAHLLAGDRLASLGFPAIAGPSDWRVFPQSRLVVYSEYGKGTGLGYLQTTFRIPDSRVVFEPEDNSSYGFRLILGADYDPCR